MNKELSYAETLGLFKDSGYELVELSRGAGRLAVCPKMGGRVVAASVRGMAGYNPFFINPVDVSNGPGAEKLVFRGGLGGRDWLGPEGCRDMSFYFRRGPLTMENWYVDDRQNLPEMAVAEATDTRLLTRGEIHLPNLRGNMFDIEMVQSMQLVEDCPENLGITPTQGQDWVGFQRETTFKNIGDAPWGETYGMAMIWYLVMLRGGDDLWIMAPFNEGVGVEVIDYEFDGPMSADRLLVRGQGQYVLFKGDGLRRGKIGQTPERSAGIMYGLDLGRQLLTVLRFEVDRNRHYLDNRWTEEAATHGGDVMDAYNNLNTAQALPGRFCEMEAVSRGLALEPGESASLRTVTGFFECGRKGMEAIVKETSGRDLTGERFGDRG